MQERVSASDTSAGLLSFRPCRRAKQICVHVIFLITEKRSDGIQSALNSQIMNYSSARKALLKQHSPLLCPDLEAEKPDQRSGLIKADFTTLQAFGIGEDAVDHAIGKIHTVQGDMKEFRLGEITLTEFEILAAAVVKRSFLQNRMGELHPAVTAGIPVGKQSGRIRDLHIPECTSGKIGTDQAAVGKLHPKKGTPGKIGVGKITAVEFGIHDVRG